MRSYKSLVPMFLLLGLNGSTCAEVPPRPTPVPGASCEDSCARLRTLEGCEALGAKSKTGVTCETACKRALENAFPYDTACIAGATSCPAARQCKGIAPAPAASSSAAP